MTQLPAAVVILVITMDLIGPSQLGYRPSNMASRLAVVQPTSRRFAAFGRMVTAS